MFEPEVVATNHGFVCHYTPTIMDGPVFRWFLLNSGAEVTAGRKGVTVDTGFLAIKNLGPLIALIQLAEGVAFRLGRNDRDTDTVKDLIREAAKGVS